MVTLTAAADSWKSWLDDAPLPETFNSATGGLQDFITALSRALLASRAELDTTQTQVGDWIVRADEAKVKVEKLEAELARVRADAELAVAEALREAAEACQYLHVAKTKNRHGPWNSAVLQCCELLRAIAPADALAEVQRLRAEIADLKMNMDADLRTMVREGQQLRTLSAELAASRAREAVLVDALETVRDTDSFSAAQRAAFAALTSTALAQTPTDPGDGWTWNERLGWIGPDGKPADPRRRG